MSKTGIAHIALIGFGEVGQTFSRGFRAAGIARVTAFDILFDDARGDALKARAAEIGVDAAKTAAEAARGADIVFSAVTAGSSLAVARQAADYLAAGQVLVDLNSVSPQEKQASAEAVAASAGHYVEAAVMSPVAGKGVGSPILLGGGAAAETAARLNAIGMNMTVASERIGVASAKKMCRSIMVKGLEALTVECLVAARLYGVDEDVLASLNQTYPGIDWPRQSAYHLDRVLVHGKRRAEEMTYSAATVKAAGVEPLMTASIAKRQQWVADLGVDYDPERDAKATAGELADKIVSAMRKKS